MKTNINGLWRFYDGANKISGITVGENRDEALDNAMNYIREFFDDIMKKNQTFTFGELKPMMIIM